MEHEITLYPLYIVWKGGYIAIANQAELEDKLKQIFADESTIKVIRSLLAQAQA